MKHERENSEGKRNWRIRRNLYPKLCILSYIKEERWNLEMCKMCKTNKGIAKKNIQMWRKSLPSAFQTHPVKKPRAWSCPGTPHLSLTDFSLTKRKKQTKKSSPTKDGGKFGSLKWYIWQKGFIYYHQVNCSKRGWECMMGASGCKLRWWRRERTPQSLTT